MTPGPGSPIGSRTAPRVAIVSNGNFFSTLMIRPLFDAADVDVAGALLVRIPPGGGGGSTGRLVRIARRTGARYAAHKAATVALPLLAGQLTGRPMFLDRLCRRRAVPSRSVDDANAPASVAFLRRLAPDVLVSVSVPQRLDPGVLAIPSIAAINIHWGLLPRYAGIAPYFWVLRHGERRTGLTIHVMAPQLDVGPVLRQREVEIHAEDTSLSLQLRLARAGAEELVAAVQELPGSLERAREQDLTARSYFSWPRPEDVAALHRRGRRLARWRDYREALRLTR